MREIICSAVKSDTVKGALLEELNKRIDLPLLSEEAERKLLEALWSIFVDLVERSFKCA